MIEILTKKKDAVLSELTTQISTIQGDVKKPNKSVATKCPIEFNYPHNARIKWLAMYINKPYQLLLGMDWIGKNVKEINIKNKEVYFTNGVSLPFISKAYEEINVLEVSEIRNIQTSHLNEKEKKVVENLIKKYNKLLYKEGDTQRSQKP